jgi:lipopolysaccharide transport system permease protein
MNRYSARPRKNSWAHMRDVLWVLVGRDFKLRYKRSLFGIAWSMLVPLAQFGVLWLVFRRFVPLNIPHFTTFLFTGLLPWTWLQSSLLTSALSVVDNRELVKQPGFPVGLLPMTSVLSQSAHFLLALPLLGLFMAIDGCPPTLALAALPGVILIQLILIISLSYIVASIQVRFRDLQYLLGIALFLGFYLTPIFWDVATVQEDYRHVLEMNPLTALLNGYRSILVNGSWPELQPLLTVAAGSIVVLALGIATFSITRTRFVEEL